MEEVDLLVEGEPGGQRRAWALRPPAQTSREGGQRTRCWC